MNPTTRTFTIRFTAILAAISALLSASARVAGADESLRRAALANDTTLIRRLLREGVDVNVLDDYGFTALHTAAVEGNTASVALLLSRGANVNIASGSHRLTPLHLACREGRAGIASMLLRAGANRAARTGDGKTALDLALESAQAAPSGVDSIIGMLGPAPNPALRAIQERLAGAGFGPAKLDGMGGASTAAAIRRFQADRGIRVSGVLNSSTLEKLQGSCATPSDSSAGAEGAAIVPIVFPRKEPWHMVSDDYRPDYESYHTIIHIASVRRSTCRDERGARLSCWVALIDGVDPASGIPRKLGQSINMNDVLTGVSRSGRLEGRAGEPGTRITFGGSPEAPFEPIPGLAFWKGWIDIDPQRGIVFCVEGGRF